MMTMMMMMMMILQDKKWNVTPMTSIFSVTLWNLEFRKESRTIKSLCKLIRLRICKSTLSCVHDAKNEQNNDGFSS